ncbi:hypothetical protein JAAARDRAFT_41191 [Jaapia argillacea MUCL 33604]|uniref:Pyridoxamine 5'-phosphate oxidase N-terminal domain-containing protein n=1 Tax=Jaapia argillacea MUCL 33604 TaxID=933084 RepID=A0A067P8V0_9AGAM|nr:hypothetical protein JAAARDRAFT_41191 [Jaapia argillacea MUCL 33604]
MGKFFTSIPPDVLPWIAQQQCFWVSTAPLSPSGHVNLSPKGIRDCFHVIDENTVWYEDLTGSGNETISHLKENGRITIMFSAFEGPPRILRLFGRGTVHEFGTEEYNTLIPPQKRKPGSRAAIVINVYKVGTSCGYAVPYYQFLSHRSTLHTFFAHKESLDRASSLLDASQNEPDSSALKSTNGLKAYWQEKNSTSLDGLPGIELGPLSEEVPVSDESWRVDPGMSERGKKVRETGVKEGDRKRLVGAFLGGVFCTLVCIKVWNSRM